MHHYYIASLLILSAAACTAESEGPLGPECGDGTVEVGGECVPDSEPSCAAGTTRVDDECVPDGSVICEQGTAFDPASGTCEVDDSACGDGTVLVGRECVPFDDTLIGDVTEGAEPNDLTGTPASFELPGIGEAPISLSGCVDPIDADGDGDPDIDEDAFLFSVAAPAMIDVTIDGTGGASAGFVVRPDAESRLDRHGWYRIGADLVSDGARRRVFLPTAGTYSISATDARSIMNGLPAGSPEACYFAQVSRVPVPDAGALPAAGSAGLLGDPAFYEYTGDGDLVITYGELSVNEPGARGSLVVLIDGEYATSEAADQDGRARVLIPTHEEGARISLVVDAVYDVSLGGADYSVDIVDPGLLAEPGDGRPVAITHSDEAPAVQLYFHAEAGEVIRFQFDPNGDDFSVLIAPPSLSAFIGELCYLCTGPVDTWVATQETGLHFLNVWNLSAADGEQYEVAFTRTHVTPTLLPLGGWLEGSLLGEWVEGSLSTADRAWFALDVIAPGIVEFALTPTGGADFTEADVRFFDRAGHGQLDVADSWVETVPAIDSVTTDGTPFFRNYEGAASLLISVSDPTGHDGDESFELSAGIAGLE